MFDLFFRIVCEPATAKCDRQHQICGMLLVNAAKPCCVRTSVTFTSVGLAATPSQTARHSQLLTSRQQLSTFASMFNYGSAKTSGRICLAADAKLSP